MKEYVYTVSATKYVVLLLHNLLEVSHLGHSWGFVEKH